MRASAIKERPLAAGAARGSQLISTVVAFLLITPWKVRVSLILLINLSPFVAANRKTAGKNLSERFNTLQFTISPGSNFVAGGAGNN